MTKSGFEPFWQPTNSQGLYIFFQVIFSCPLFYTWALSCPSWLTVVRITSHSHPYSRANYAALDPEPQIGVPFKLLTSWPQGECFIVGPLRSPRLFSLMIPVHTIEFHSKSACRPIMAFNILRVNVNSRCQSLNANSHRFPGPFVLQWSSRRASPLHLPCQHAHWGQNPDLTWPCPGYHMTLVIKCIRDLFCIVEGEDKNWKKG